MNKTLGFIDLRDTRPKGKKPNRDEILQQSQISHLEQSQLEQQQSQSTKDIAKSLVSTFGQLSESKLRKSHSVEYDWNNDNNNNKKKKNEPEYDDLSPTKHSTLRLFKKEQEILNHKKNKDLSHPEILSLSEDALKRLHSMIVNFLMLENGKLTTSVDMYQYGLYSGQIITNLFVQELSIIQPNIERLNLSNCSEITDISLWALAKHCNPDTLQELNLSGCNQITNIGLRSLALKSYSIHTFNFNNCTNVDDMLLTVLASGSWKIQKLYLRNCKGISDAGVSKVARVGSQLEVLDLNGCTGIGEFGENAMKEIGIYCGNLIKLDLSQCRRIEDYGIRSIAIGCTKLEELIIDGCDRITGISIQAICKHLKNLRVLGLIKCTKLVDSDMESFYQSNMRPTLTDLDISGCSHITDRGTRAIAYSFSSNLTKLNLSSCRHISDQSSQNIASMCYKLRELDLSRCPNVTDSSIQTLATTVTGLTTLKLNKDHHITIKALLNHLQYLEFAVISQDWLGYQPKVNANELIIKREQFNYELKYVIKIQSAIRRKFAYIEYSLRKRTYLIRRYIPKFQAIVRGYFQRKRYRKILYEIYRIQCIVKLQTWYRKYIHIQKRLKMDYEIKSHIQDHVSSTKIQRVYRGMIARIIVQKKRYDLANQLIQDAKNSIILEKKALIIQKHYRAYLARKLVFTLIRNRNMERDRKQFESMAGFIIQRIVRGKLGRIKAQKRRMELNYWKYCIKKATDIQRVYRGYLGRIETKKRRGAYELYNRIRCATLVQRIYRGYRGRLQGSVAYAVRVLKFAQINASIQIQRMIRGVLDRQRIKLYREELHRFEYETKAAMKIQKMYRGFKGREMILLENELKKFDVISKPLIQNLQTLESNCVKLKGIVSSMTILYKNDSDDMEKLQSELEYVMKTESKYCDSSRITNYPQRFLTKYLRIRLKEYYDNKKEQMRVREEEIDRKVIELRTIESQIRAAKRELVPLTTGKIMSLKQGRINELRMRVRLQQQAATKIQSMWRKTLVRMARNDVARDYWIECLDEEQSEYPFYFNTWTQETSWTKPLAYKYYCDSSIGIKSYRKRKGHINEDGSGGSSNSSSGGVGGNTNKKGKKNSKFVDKMRNRLKLDDQISQQDNDSMISDLDSVSSLESA